MKKFLEDPDANSDRVSDLLQKVLQRVKGHYERKEIKRLIPLFAKHDFWSTQPVQKIYEKVDSNDMNGPIETKKVSEVP